MLNLIHAQLRNFQIFRSSSTLSWLQSSSKDIPEQLYLPGQCLDLDSSQSWSDWFLLNYFRLRTIEKHMKDLGSLKAMCLTNTKSIKWLTSFSRSSISFIISSTHFNLKFIEFKDLFTQVQWATQGPLHTQTVHVPAWVRTVRVTAMRTLMSHPIPEWEGWSSRTWGDTAEGKEVLVPLSPVRSLSPQVCSFYLS